MKRQGYQRFWLALGAPTAVVAAFLLVRLTAWPPHEDETLALFVARDSLGSVLETVLGERGGAPLHFLVAWVVAHSGGGLVELRLASALFAAASVPVAGLLAARLAGRTAALAAAVVVSASWLLLFHGVYARMYSLFLLTSALSYLALLGALDGRRRRWLWWVVAAMATVASHPYGALVVASQGLYVLWRGRLRDALTPFAAVAVLGIPFWYADLNLAGRFEVGLGPGAERLGGPFGVVRYLGRVAGDMTAGWLAVELAALAAALYGFVLLWRERRESAQLAAVAIATPAAALALARLGETTSPESRHLIFLLPFMATMLGVAFVRLGVSGAVALAALAVAQVAWAWNKTPPLFEGERSERAIARDHASDFLARTQRENDILFGYEPLYLGAWERTRGGPRVVVPRADARLALEALRDAEPLGRGVWIFDASENNNINPKLAIEHRVPYPHGAFETRVFGPFLIVRTRDSTETADRYLAQAERVQRMGKSLFIGDADVNFQTVRRAAARLYEDERSRSTVSR